VRADKTCEWWVHGVRQTPADREWTRKALAETLRWSPLRAAFVAAAVSRVGIV
jgi:hypothetical protein